MKQIVSAVLSLTIFISSAAAVFAKPSDIPYRERTLTVNTEGINNAINTLISDLQKSNNKDKVFEDYHALLDLASANGDIRQINMIELEKLNYDMPTNYNREFLNTNINEAVKYGNDIKMAVKSILGSRYGNDFKKYWGSERTEHITQIRDNTKEFKEEKKFYDRYFELINENADSLEFAKLLKELILYNNASCKDEGFDNYIDYIYASDNAGFTAADIENYVQNTIGGYYYYVNKFKNYGNNLGFDKLDEIKEVKNPLAALSYTKNINSEISEAYDYLVKNGLVFLGASEKIFGATAEMPSYGDAVIIVSGKNNPIAALIHEFGHFQSFLNTEKDSEYLFFGEQYRANFQEFNSQAFELISTDCYEDIYGESAKGEKFKTIVSLMQQLAEITMPAMLEIILYQGDLTQISDAELNKRLTSYFGEQWYNHCQQFFTHSGNYINYSLMLFNVLQLYDLYLHDKTAGIEKYLEACSYQGGSYNELTQKLGFKSAFDQNAGEYLEQLTNDIFKTEYNIDYTTALDYFENGTYLGKVEPTAQRVSVNGGGIQTLYAYNSNGFNYIRIRDLARLLSGTEKQFGVEYDTDKYTVNIIPGKPYTYDGTEMNEIIEIKTAGQKNNGTFTLMYNGEKVLSGGAMFINGWNCYRLRGLVENGILDLDIDYDAESDTVLIHTAA